jgi:hypothetical protein
LKLTTSAALSALFIIATITLLPSCITVNNYPAPARTATTAPSPTPAPAVSSDHPEAPSAHALPQSLADAVKAAIDAHTYDACSPVGGGFAHEKFEDLPPTGGILIGFRYALGKFFDNDYVCFIQPIYLIPAGEVRGEPHGQPSDDVREVKARPGYAIGGLDIRGGGGLDAIQITFMRIGPDNSLDIGDTYTGDRIGGPGGGESAYISDGTPIIGICGTAAPGNPTTYMGLAPIFMKPTPADHAVFPPPATR